MKSSKLLKIFALALPFSMLSISYADDHQTGETNLQNEAVDFKETEKPNFDFSEENLLSLLEHDDLMEMQKAHGADLLVVNFWATWCAPCVKELPYFEALDEAYKNKGVRVVGLSMDYDFHPDNWVEVTTTTMDRRGVDFANFGIDVDSMKTFPKFSKNWVGNLPATFIFDKEGNLLDEMLSAVEKEVLFERVEKSLAKVKEQNVSKSETPSDSKQKS